MPARPHGPGGSDVSFHWPVINGSALQDIVVADQAPNKSNDSGLGVLLNQGGGVFPAAGITASELFPAGPNPSSVVLGDFVVRALQHPPSSMPPLPTTITRPEA